MSDQVRLFVAVEVPDAVRTAVAGAVAPLRQASPRLRWVAPERYHLTLAFLGSVGPAAVPGVGAALDAAVVTCGGPFALRLDGRIGSFGRRVLWAGLEASPALEQLAAAVAREVGAVVALPDGDRAFSAHLTLARAGRKPGPLGQVGDGLLPQAEWTVDRVVLMQSAGGYSVVHAAALRASGA